MKIFMLCEPCKELPNNLEGYAAEPKLDGCRAALIKTKEAVKIINRNNVDITFRYPELLTFALLNDKRTFTLDGEIVVYKDDKIDFQTLQSREHQSSPLRIKILSGRTPATFIAFDILELNSEDLRTKPLHERRQALAKTAENPIAHYKEAEQIRQLYDKREGEGIILKRLDSTYKAARSPEWLKIKFTKEEAVTFTGYEENPDGITLTNGKNRVAIHGQEANTAKRQLQEEGKIVVNVEYLNETESQHLRQPIYRGVVT